MMTFEKHIKVLRALFVALFFLSSAGFTTVLHLCVMEAAECCDESGMSDHKACHDGLPAPSGVSVKDRFECHLDSVAGGLNNLLGLLEKQTKHQHVKVELAPVAVLETADRLSSCNSFLLSSHRADLPPPSVEKYILASTFLI